MTDQELKDLVASLAISQAETSKQMKKASEEMAKWFKKSDESFERLKESQRQTDEQMKKSDEKWQKISDKIDHLWKLYWDSENNKWIEVEEYFYRYFRKHKYLWKIKFDEVDRNIISADWQEHDIVLINWKVSALISIKYKLKKQDVDDMVEREIWRVKYFFTKLWSKHKLYAWIASFIVNEEVEKYAKSKWLYVFSRKWDDVLALNDKDFIWTEF